MLNVTTPSKEDALQFALMIKSGMPTLHAIQYFFSGDEDPERLKFEHDRWLRSQTLKDAIDHVQGKPWKDMSLNEQINFAIEKHYAELAYFLYSHNYAELVGAERQKADICRSSLETKLAGMSGKMTPITQWFDDVKTGKVKLPYYAV